MAKVFFREGRFDTAHAYIEQAKPHAVNDAYLLARASALQAKVWKERSMFADAKPEASRALDVFESSGLWAMLRTLGGFSSRLARAIRPPPTTGEGESVE